MAMEAHAVLSTPMASRVGGKAMKTPDDARRMFASPVFSPGESPAAATGAAKAAAVAGNASAGVDSTLTAELRTVIAPLEKQISTVVRDVSRLEREKAQWMELYAQSEIDFAAMISRSTNDAARAVAADCDAFAVKVQSHWVAAAARRRDRARVSDTFYAWSEMSSRAQALRRLLSRALERAADNRLRDALGVWMAVCFCGGLREDSTRAGASPLGSGSPAAGDATLAKRLEGIAAYAKTLADDFDAASPSKRHAQEQAVETPSQPDAVLTDSKDMMEAKLILPSSERAVVESVEANGQVEECPDDSAESADDADVQSFLNGIISGESEADDSHSLVSEESDAGLSDQSQEGHYAQLGGELERLYDMLAVASSMVDDCDAEILPSDLVNETHHAAVDIPLEMRTRPEAPLAEFLELEAVPGAGYSPGGLTRALDFSTVQPAAPIHAVCDLEQDSYASSTSRSADSEDAEHVEDEYVPDVACVTIDLEGLMARYESQLGRSVAFDLENGGLLSAFERAAIVQMETTARAHYVDGLLRLVLYSWVEFTKWSLGTAHAHLEKQEVAGDPADVTVLGRVADGAAPEDLRDGGSHRSNSHSIFYEAFSETGSIADDDDSDIDSLLHEAQGHPEVDGHDSVFSADDYDWGTDTDGGFDYESCMPGCFGESYSDASSSPDWAGDGDSFLLEQKVSAQRARKTGGSSDWTDSAVPYAVPAFADPYVQSAEQHQQEQAEERLLLRINHLRGDCSSTLRNRWADQLLLDLNCSAVWSTGYESSVADSSPASSFSEQLSEGSGSDLFGSTVAFNGDASSETEVPDSMLAPSDCSEGSSDCADVDAQADRLLEQVAKLSPEDAELAGLVEESIRTLDSLQQAIAAVDAADAAAAAADDRTVVDRKRCDDLCAQHKDGDDFSPPISPTSPLDCFAAGQQFSGLAA